MKKLLLLPGLILGIAVFWYMSQNKIGPEKTQIQERAKPVRIIPAPKVILIPIAVGNGYVQPERTWKAVAEVAGKIVDFNPDLQQGAFVAKGDLLVSIAPEHSQLALQEIQAEIQKLQAQVEELDQKKADTQRQLEVEKRSLEIYTNELERKQKLFKGGIISRSDLNREEQNLLTQKNTVESYKGVLNQLPSERRALKASLRALQTRSQDARITLKKTVIKAPFDSRVAEVNIQRGQAATAGQILITLDSVKTSEVLVQVSRHYMKNLIPRNLKKPIDIQNLKGLSRGDAQGMFGLQAIVRLEMGGRMAEWEGRFARFGETDIKTGSIGVYIAVDNPFQKIQPGKKPPLQKNMYVEVELRGKPRDHTIVIPRSAVHQGQIYIANEKDRLEKRTIEVDFQQGNLVSVKSGIHPNEKIIISDLVPAISGMLLKPQIDEVTLAKIIKEATGSKTVK
jgi:RND family efflux transporter MFP subunit